MAAFVTPDEIVSEAIAATGVSNAQWLTQGGQKWVLTADLAGNPVVLKIVPVPPGPVAQIAVKRAHREVELLAAVESPHLVSVLSEAIEIGDVPSAVVWLEERLDGADLSLELGVQWDDMQVVAMLRDLARGLIGCHELAVVHRDLSPGNVRHTSEGRFVVMDPGFARHLERSALTGIHQPGTPGFRTPEHVPGGSPTPASDIFGVGILAFFARSGQFPVDPSGEDHEYDRRLRTGQAAPISSLVSSIDGELAVIIDRCLQRQPARRYLDGGELFAALEATAIGSAEWREF
ncbi:hypothetical protein D9V29_14030 [Mycetocola manganoxydans]|uniref:non-specific serine/threonine protein kinase n=1 Tax=Mycetocola manganoxydans TaxID=699879 RepID=A0A3L6ZKC6_9MICO|nr:protein kinase [Mycetocola manganoxydans]RLP68340.1 hypothetical protein D9V29_14030 [Mycetocola manganoxydans]GHD43822.1 hypothetical protein GCM10008097_10970 [Mycetocola manganoxydans]